MSERSPKDFKLFPRNLTARAGALVRGNPVSTRPESGVENAFPGLEFDQRNLDKAFFPGLLFELHHDFGVILRRLSPDAPAARFFKPADLTEGVFLVFLQGLYASRTPGVSPSPRVLRFVQPAGLESWRMVRDLEPGPVAVALAGAKAYQAIASGAVDAERAEAWFEERRDRKERFDRGKVVLLFGERARYLTADGVIDPALLEPGDLTRSLCSPWQYDFADCGCFYWASNKPDLVSSEAQPRQVLNFQRKDRSAEGDRATTAEDWLLKHRGAWDGPALAMRHAEMMERWSELPFVVGGREGDRYPTRPPGRTFTPLGRDEIIARLRSLAAVEHALAIEYLYAYYSLALPPTRPPEAAGPASRVWTAGEDIFQVALDEMRHLRAVNEILTELGQPPALQRAAIIGEDFDNDGKAFRRPFELAPLRARQLDWFIAVEAASQNAGAGEEETIDGMYTLILRSIGVAKDFRPEEKRWLAQQLKTVIDEGIEHYERFSNAKKALAGISEGTYLRVTAPPTRLPEGQPDRLLQDTLDAAYGVVLRSLEYVFRKGDQQRGALLEGARRAMFNMDDIARSLAARGVPALFDPGPAQAGAPPGEAMTAGLAPGARPDGAHAVVRSIGEPLRPLLGQLAQSASPGHQDLARRVAERLEAMSRVFEDAAAMDR
jgi:hypothetical protein